MLSVINEAEFNVTSGLYVVKFWATWCGPCRVLTPTINKLDEEFENIKFLSVDVDQVPALAQKFKIKSLPTLLFIKDGEVVNKIIGVHLIDPLRASLRELDSPLPVAEDKKEATA